jgi:hypothetical protein
MRMSARASRIAGSAKPRANAAGSHGPPRFLPVTTVNELSAEGSYQITVSGKTFLKARTIIAKFAGVRVYIGSHIEITPSGERRSAAMRKYSSL